MKHLGGDGAPMHLPVASLGLSEEFTSAAVEHGYNTLSDFQPLSVNDLLELGWFTGAMFVELSHILKQLHKLVSHSE